MKKLSASVAVTAIVLGAGLTAPAFAQVNGSDKYHFDGEVRPITANGNASHVPLFDKDPSTPAADPIVMRTATVGDLVFQVHAECTTLVNGDDGNINVRVHVELDGQPVPVVLAGSDDGKVNFCDRRLLDPGSQVDQTSSSPSFKWVALNVGNGDHTVQAYADFEVSPGDSATIGRRSIEIFTTTTQQN
jgi:hypothetical protein